MLSRYRSLTATAVLAALVAVVGSSSVNAQNPFQKNDRDGDGYLTPQEIQQARGQRGQGGPRQLQQGTPRQSPPTPPASSTASPRSGPLRFIDTHMHLHPIGLDKTHGNQRGGFGGGRLDEAAALAKAAENLIDRMDQQRLSTALIVVIPSSRQGREQSYRLLRDTVRRHPGRLRLMAGGSLLQAMLLETEPGAVTETIKRRFRDTAERLLSEGATGFGEMMAYHLCMNPQHKFEAAAPDHPLFLLLADIAAQHDVAVDLHMEAIEKEAPIPENLLRRCDKNPDRLVPTIPGFERLLGHNRKTRIVWQHIGWDNTGQMAPHRNLYLSLRVTHQLVTRDGRAFPNRIVDTRRRLKAEWRQLMEDFPERFMLGADEFVGPSPERAQLAASFEATWAIVDQLSDDLAVKIGATNARRVYRLD